VFSNIDLTIKRGEKVAFVGKNGEGKSTLVKCIMDEIDYAGKLTLGHNVQIGYFAQNQASLLNESKSVFETIDDVAVGDIRTKIRDILGAFMFGGEEADKKVKVLSGGERSRLAMIRLLLHPVNLLILDEPTNHLDIRSKDVLKQAIKEFDGTVIVVSHDREFLDGLVTKVYEFADKKIIEHIGGVYDFLQKKKLSSVQEIERKVLPNKETSSSVQHDTDQKLTYEERKERIKILRKAEKILETCEHDIAKLEKELETIEQAMLQAENAADVSFVASYTQKKRALEQKYYEWELLAEDVETKKSELSN
jgi:ATP-binding cassette, subfamily F, member 3